MKVGEEVDEEEVEVEVEESEFEREGAGERGMDLRVGVGGRSLGGG